MKFLVVTHVQHRRKSGEIGGYAPYIREMNLWFRHVDAVRVIAPVKDLDFGAIDLAYAHPDIQLDAVPSFNVIHWRNAIHTIINFPLIVLRIFVGMLWADHIHIRCPGNMGLIACFVQLLFPFKQKSAKYAGNWDPSSTQPLTYRIQRWLLKNPWLTRRMQVLVYGNWPNSTKNVRAFFTASYSQNESVTVSPRRFDGGIHLVFLGALSPGKRPLMTARAANNLIQNGYQVHLDFLGEGQERHALTRYIEENNLASSITLHGNVSSEYVKATLKSAHFLIFPSRSEGWPKAVAEAMYWGCVPVTTRVSCIADMLDEHERGILIAPEEMAIASAVRDCWEDSQLWERKSMAAAKWARSFTLERFEAEIAEVLRVKNQGLCR